MIVPRPVSKKDEKYNNGKEIAFKTYEEASQYYKAANILEDNREIDELFAPVLMNALFSCELYSKAILYATEETELVKKHSLYVLYNMFNDDIKGKMKQLYKGIDIRFEQFLEEISELFEIWRYRYEYKKMDSHYSFIFEYLNIIKQVSDEIFISDIQ